MVLLSRSQAWIVGQSVGHNRKHDAGGCYGRTTKLSTNAKKVEEEAKAWQSEAPPWRVLGPAIVAKRLVEPTAHSTQGCERVKQAPVFAPSLGPVKSLAVSAARRFGPPIANHCIITLPASTSLLPIISSKRCTNDRRPSALALCMATATWQLISGLSACYSL